jgi:preprotein translocase subunit SecG
MLIGLLSHYFFGITIFFTSLFLILLVLVQRGRGGGIAGALGGAGGQSAFGTKAGDLFTRITVAVATIWILLSCAAIIVLKGQTFTTGIPKRDAQTGTVTGIGEESGTLEVTPAQTPPADAATQAADAATEAAQAEAADADASQTEADQTVPEVSELNPAEEGVVAPPDSPE